MKAAREWMGSCFVVSKMMVEHDNRFVLQRVIVDLLPHYYVKRIDRKSDGSEGTVIFDMTGTQYNHTIDYRKGRNPGKWWK
jgi:hypothetical protein